MIHRNHSALWVALALFCTACTSYRYIPPQTAAGRQCVTTCETNKQICTAGKEQTAAVKTQACETRRATQLSSCLALAGSDKGAREQCAKKSGYCSTYADTSACEESYRACYVQCGGQVVLEES
ncbi:hypothetical protein [Ralstonia sp. UBA689]|uniref:hypothetical protein n=1 Tax=Ralstonia sp. UBA689 TaxID=1947373 RepID=UPI0026002554|nr:hypothetical protein [Ralstonia sp. UBA689]